LLPPAPRVELPTYALRRRRYWPAGGAAGDPAALGLAPGGHALLGAAVVLASGDGAVLTGRVSAAEHPWLADHVVAGQVVVPGTALLDLALHAAEQVGATAVLDLAMQAPLVLPAGGVLIQVVVGRAADDGSRPVTVHSRPDDAPWTRHAIGAVGTTVAAATARVDPQDGDEILLDDLHAGLSARGVDYGPAFQGLVRAQRDGDTVVAEVTLPEPLQPSGFGVHPALLDAALHATALGGFLTDTTTAHLPFSWQNAHLLATGATALRVRLAPAGQDTVTVTAVDPAGAPVLSAELSFRPLSETAPGAAPVNDLYRLDWVPVAAEPVDSAVSDADVLGALDAGGEVVWRVGDPALAAVLPVLRHAAAGEARLVALLDGDDPDFAAVGGLLRSAGTEHPGRFAVVDGHEPVRSAEPWVRVRDGVTTAPRLARATATTAPSPFGPDSTVLITGGTGTLGSLLARHLVEAHGVRGLVLASRSGGTAPELPGADVTVVACDVSDPDQVRALLTEHAVTAVVHAAGILDDGVLESITPDRAAAVAAPKADAVRVLDAATRDRDLTAFVAFSAAANLFGNPGQGAYAAANAAVDAVIAARRAAALPGVALAWGLWERASGMTGHLADRDLARMDRGGVRALTDARGLELFDAALAAGDPLLVPLGLDLAAARAEGDPHPLLRGLVRPARKRAAAGGATPSGFAALSGRQRRAALLDVVRAQVAAVLGHDSADGIDPGRAFRDLGFDSLTAVELRNRLATATGERLPATVVFDHPTPQALAELLAGRLEPAADRAPVAAAAADEPIAIIGMACRFPGGVRGPDDLWELVTSGGDAVGGFPTDRGWDLDGGFDPTGERPGSTSVRAGAFLHDALEFDADLFGISPREALATDPQQRLLLETAWEAFEAAGIDPRGVRGSRTGVFAGLMHHDHASRLHRVPAELEGLVGTGASASVASGRVAYAFGLEGPALTVDTACSSSLVAIHLAARALRSGECDLALAGGATVLSTPGLFVEFSRQRGLAPDGRCKPFSDSADGTGFGEGVGLLLLAPLSAARRLGHPVLAVLRGSAVNSDGASNGLTAPNGPSQERVIRAALADAGLRPSDVDMVEAHGTGTTLGDPIEAHAVLATYGQDRTDPVWLGSVKSNIGHTQAAAGVAGVIKVVQAVRHGVLPGSLHAEHPSAHVDWSAGAVSPAAGSRAWDAEVRRAGVSSFGVSGTNAHVVIEQAPGPAPAADAPERAVPWVVSGHTESAVREQVARLLAADPAGPVETAAALATGRAALPWRVTAAGRTRAELAAGIEAAVPVEAVRRRTAFVYTGQGSQRPGMGRGLAAAFPVFAEAWDEVVGLFPAEVRAAIADGSRIGETRFAQPAIFAFEVALTRLLGSWGVVPDVVVGHSVGELAAAWAAGVFPLADAARLVVERGALMGAVTAEGAMAAIAVPEDAVELPGGVEVAAVNAADSVVVSGDADAVRALVATYRECGVKASLLKVSHAFHCAHVDEVLPAFRAVVEQVERAEPAIEFIGVAGGHDPAGVDYWVDNVRRAVRFADGVARLGAVHAIEVGPEAALAPFVPGCVPAQRRSETPDEEADLVRALGLLHAVGAPVAWAAFFGTGLRRVALPTYAFQRRRYWLDAAIPARGDDLCHRVEWTPVHVGTGAAGARWGVLPGDPALTAELLAAGAVEDGATGWLLPATSVEHLLATLRDLDDERPVWVVTRGAVAVQPGTEVDPGLAAVWGAGRVAALELPGTWGGLLDVETGAQALAFAGGREDQVAVRSDGAWARRLAPAPAAPAGWTPSGTVLITGGTGALGQHTARRLLADGAERVVLVSRGGTPVDIDGAHVVAADATDEDAMRAVVEQWRPTAVVHAAGVALTKPLIETTDDDLAAVAAAKVAGAEVLDRVTRDLPLDAFVVFSSIAGAWGSGGQVAYAAANARVDALVANRRAAGLPGTALAWGPWDGAGMGGGRVGADLAALGLRPLLPARALDALHRTGAAHLVVADVDWPRFTETFTARRPSPLLERLAPAPAAPVAVPAVVDLPSEDDLLDLVRTTTAAVLGHADKAAVGADRTFRDLGVDSLTAVEVRNALTAATGLALPAAVVFDHPTPRDLVARITADLAGRTAAPARTAAATDEPIAIVGMACRFPGGVDSPERLWEALVGGRDLVGPFPADRGWTGEGRGGFLDAAAFDAGFFAVSPREAVAMDPQQRVLLQVAWEALERAGIDPTGLRGAPTGVFAGISGQDYVSLLGAAAEDVSGHVLTGNAVSVASGRIAYALGLEGPAVSVDTACSSSLVALHWAARSLRSGECDLALAGGVTVMPTQGTFTEFAKQGGLSADGRCKAFADGADGTGWSEGAGVLVVERLSDARARGHRVLAVLRGSAVNQDGASNGLTAPNGPAQERVIRAALAAADLDPSDVDVVEAHGTGTALGDPIEAEALLRTYGAGRDPRSPLWLGSLKSNTGHTQAAAGVAGVIKVVLALRNGTLPRTLHAERPTAHVDWSAGSVRLLSQAQPWPEGDRVRRAGVSSFGMSGTNAHVILEQGDPVEPTADARVDAVVPFLVSARTPEALRAQAARLAAALPALPASDAAHSLATTRALMEHRAVAVGADAVAALAAGSAHPLLVSGAAGEPGKVAFVFPGQGSQWVGMAHELAAESPAFAARLAECAAALSGFVDWSLDEALGDVALVERVDVVQPVLWAVMVSLAEVWRSWGIEPSAVVGHSQGEIAAAVVAGALSLEDGARVVALRSKVLLRLAGRGGMASVALGVDDVRARIAPFGERLSVAAVNGSTAVVVSGEPSALDELVAGCAADDVRAKRIAVDYASHSAQVDELADELLAALAPVRPVAGTIPVRSTVTGRTEDGTAFDAAYWVRNLRSPVEFADAVDALVAEGFGTFVECSPHPVLTMSLPEGVTAVGSLKRDEGGLARALLSLGELVVAGVTPDWAAVVPGRPVDLPTYAFQEQRYWPTPRPVTGDVTAAGLAATGHPLLAAAVALPAGGQVLTGRISVAALPWLADHVVAGQVVIPGTALLDMVLLAAGDALADLTFAAPLVLPAEGGVDVRVTIDGAAGGAIEVHARPDGGDWTRHATATPGAPALPAALGEWPPAEAVEIGTDTLADLYADLAVAGLSYGPAFQGLRRAWQRGDEVFAEVATDPGAEGFGLHPALLDSALHAASLGAGGAAGLPFSWTGVTRHAEGAQTLRVRLAPAGDNAFSVAAFDADGRPVLTADALALRPAPDLDAATEPLHTVEWTPVDAPAAAPPTREVVRADGTFQQVVARVQELLRGDGDIVLLVDATTETGAAAGGLGRAAAAEHPGRVVVVEARAGQDVPAALLGQVVALGEPWVRVRDGAGGTGIEVPRLVRIEPTPTAPLFGPADAVLVTGGTGALGAEVARHLARSGVRELVLASRSGGADDLVAELAGSGAAVHVAACDVSDRAAVAALLAAHRVTGVVHAAGVIGDGVVTGLTDEQVAAVWAPKVDAARHLDELVDDHAALVVFSAAAGLFGNAGQGAYAAANAALDALVARRRAAGKPAVSLAWGLWAQDSGMTGHLTGTDRRRLARAGVRPLTTPAALDLFDRALAADRALLVPIGLDLPAVRSAGDPHPLLRAMVPAASRRAATPAGDLLTLVRDTAAAVLGHDSATAVGADRAFKELGFDSLTAVELRNRLSAATGLRLPATLVFDHPTPRAAADLLAGLREPAPAAPIAPVRATAHDDPIAVVAMACRFPGADDPDALWRLVVDGVDATGGFPVDRGWVLRPDYTPVGAFLDGAADFDADLFGISPREALAMDPQQRVLLETAWEAVERAELDPRSLRGSRTGVFTGIMYSDYASRLPSIPEDLAPLLATGSSASVAAGRLAYALGLEGPAMTVDTACSSSLVALHLAAQALRAGECDLALAGGATVLSTPAVFEDFARQGGLAADGRCKPFSADADGTGFGEGVGLLVLARLSDAQRNGHPVLAVLRGSAVNSDGASNGLTAPNGPAQQRVIRAALATAGLRPSDVDLVEAHGTGTTLGDPIEAQALLATYGQDRATPLLLGSIKSNIGHTQAAAGVAGVIKAIQAIRHGVAPRSLRAGEPTPHVDWSAGSVEVLAEQRDWPAVDRPRRAAVSSFGISGTNAHVVLEQPPAAAAPRPVEPTALVWPVSGRSVAALRAQAGRLAEFAETADLAAAGVALGTTRAALEFRAAATGSDRESLIASLRRLVTGDAVEAVAGPVAFVFTGQGSQRAGMGRELAAAFPVFGAAWDEVVGLFPVEVREAITEGTRIDETQFAQPAIFAFEVAMVRLFGSWGVRPDVVIGHSVGEIAAAWAA
ncbi:SDR family NAD(P)-dependent oxidoreductase, partial [Actinokineospora sp. PR83]|uniref:type I polyketide synthase n=1 Tax=Actinokineospora sp. PR83 TaxID=2884908 RepID=UPI001F3AA7C3